MEKPPVLTRRGGITEKVFFYRNIVTVIPKFNQTFRQLRQRKITEAFIFKIATLQGVAR